MMGHKIQHIEGGGNDAMENCLISKQFQRSVIYKSLFFLKKKLRLGPLLFSFAYKQMHTSAENCTHLHSLHVNSCLFMLKQFRCSCNKTSFKLQFLVEMQFQLADVFYRMCHCAII